MNESGVARSVSVSDGRMAIEGLSTRYVQDAARRFRLSASGLRFVGGFESRDGRLEESRRFLAEATVVDGGLRRAGREGEAGTIALTLRPLSQAGEQPRLLLMLGCRDEGGASQPFAEAFLAPAVFAALEADMLAGLAQDISLSATTSLWMREEDRGRTHGEPLDWYLGLDADGRSTQPAHGFIETIEWRPRELPVAIETAPTPDPVAAPVHETEDDWPETAAEQLGKINGSFRLLLLMLAFLLIIVAMK
ncbi:hypothetical protein ASE61_20885 [Bosea sp. Root670]|uniref:hypothetical protein n=1 Tax=Bosea sp. Root670 TaxID=1736583 RepID=UPI0007124D7A|nr:hypothetical protein [Bosea sp. Root670]KRE00498.1 hypothetical protein ASE61_20885 [Bosea sp. Root670]